MGEQALLADDREALVMTANLDSHGLDDGIELGVLLDATRTAGVATILHAWAENAPFELRRAPSLGNVRGTAEVWVEKRLVPFQVVLSETRVLESVVVASAERLESEPVLRSAWQGA